MHFQAAYNYMKAGEPITLPEWGGYWRWDGETIEMCLKDGGKVDIREADDVDFTINHMFRDDWEIVSDIKSTKHHKNMMKIIAEMRRRRVS